MEAGYLILSSLSIVVVATIARALVGGTEERHSLVLESLRAVCYGMGPGLFFEWIPNPVFLSGLWATVWQAFAIHVYFEYTRTRTIVTVIPRVLVIGILHDIASLVWAQVF